MGRAERRNQAKADARQRKKAKATPESWQTQIVLCYEEEPYVAFDVTPDMLEAAIAVENPPMTDHDSAYAYVIASMNQLREDVALMRDHSEELMLVPERQNAMARKAIMMVQYLLTVRQRSMAEVGAVVLNLLARQSEVEPNSPGFRVIAFDKPFSVEDIRAMSTAQHMYVQEGDSIEKIPPPSQPSKDRSKDRACIAISALWRSDQPDGFMLEMKANFDQGQTSLDVEMDMLDQLVMMLAELQPSAKESHEYLCRMAQRPEVQHPEKDRVACFEIMAAVAYAEEAGHLQSDEYNGMLYVYHTDADGVFVARKDQPQRPPT